MKKNYQIQQAIMFRKGEELYDLHNFYDFSGFDFKVKTRTLIILFELNDEFTGLVTKPRVIEINFQGVEDCEFSDGLLCDATADFEEAGYKSPGDSDYSWLLAENESDTLDHIFLRFANDEYIRLYCKASSLNTS